MPSPLHLRMTFYPYRTRKPRVQKLDRPRDISLSTIRAILKHLTKKKNKEDTLREIALKTSIPSWDVDTHLKFLQNHRFVTGNYKIFFLYSITEKGKHLLQLINKCYSVLNWR